MQRHEAKRCVVFKEDLEGRSVCLSTLHVLSASVCLDDSSRLGSNHLGDTQLGVPVRELPERV